MSSVKKSSRVPAFDLLRGYFLIAITLNHLHYFPNGLGWLTMKGELFVSSAEGFILISGIVLGIVRVYKLKDAPIRSSISLILKRAWELYASYVVLTLLFTFIGWLFIDNPGLKYGIAPIDTPWWKVIWGTMTFEYLYGWVDYLRFYIMFLIASPLAIWLLRQGKWWILLTASTIVWWITPEYSWPENLYLQPFKWQILFFIGLTVGYHWEDITRKWRSLSASARRWIVGGVLSASIITLLLNVFLAFGGQLGSDVLHVVAPLRDILMTEYFNKETLPLARILLFLLWFSASFWLFARFSRFFEKLLGGILPTFGQHSLYVYIVTGIMIFFIHLFIPESTSFWNFIITGSIIALVFLMIRKKILFRIIPR